MTTLITQPRNRRRFLKVSALASAAITLPAFIPRRVFGANERINLGVIGMGERGNQLLSNIPGNGQIVAICDADLRKTETSTIANRASWKVFQDYRKMLDQRDLDAVIVTAADHHHVLASLLACQAGLDVYCEKPLSLYVREGRALVKAARKYDRVVQTGTQQRTMEMNRFACELVRDGGIGDVKVVECVNFSGPIDYPADGLPEQPIPAQVDWELWQGQAPAHPFNERLFSHWKDGKGNWWGNWSDYSNSQLTGLGAHAFDMVQYALARARAGGFGRWNFGRWKKARWQESIFAMPTGPKFVCDSPTRSRIVGHATERFSSVRNAKWRSIGTSSRPIRSTSSKTPRIRNWRRSGRATAGSPRGTWRTGSTASSHAPSPTPTSKSVIGRQACASCW